MPAPARILLVDDTDHARAAAARVLRGAGHEVEEAADGEEAVRRARAHPPALILLDVVLPGLSGFDVLRRLRADPATENLPVVFLSSQKVSPEDHAEGLDLGADGYITRPVANSELLARVRLHLRQIELTERLRTSEVRFRDLISNQSDGVLVVDREGTVQFANPAAGRLFGTSPDNLVGQPFGFPIDGAEAHEIEIQGPGGHGIVAEIRVSETEWSGEPAWIATLNDITERIRAETERDTLLSELGERVKELRLYHGAAETLRKDGTPLDEIIRDIVRLIPPAMRVPECAEAKIVLGDTEAATAGYEASGNRLTVDFALRGERSGRIDVAYVRDLPESSEAAFLDEERRILQSLGDMLRAAYDRCWTENERSRGETLLRIAGKVARIGGWTIELPDRNLTWSDEVRAIHEVSEGEQPTLEEAIHFYPPEYRAEVAERVQRCINEGIPFQFEMELNTAKGRRIPVQAIGEAVRSEAGEIIGLQGALQDLSELKAAEASAAASERRFRQLAESMPLIVWTADPDGNIEYANQRLFEATGAKPHEDPHTRWQRFVHPNDLKRALEEWMQCVREERAYDIVYRLRHRRDNEYHWFRVQAQPVRDPDGTVSHWFGTAVDIHETKCLEEKAKQLAERLTRTFESITDGFFTLDREWRITYVNPEMERFLGKDRQDLYGNTIWSDDPRVIGTPFEQAYRKAMAENVTVRIEEYYAPMDRWLSIRVYPSADGLSVFLQDVTQRRRDEEQMRLLATSVASLNDIVMITKAAPLDEPGPEIVFVNEAFERLTGYTDAEVIGRTPRILQGPESDPGALRRIREALAAGRHIREEVLNYAKDGREYILEINLHPVRDAEGTITHFVAVERNITEERAVQEALRESEERFRTLLRDIPTVAIQGYGLDGSVHYWNKASEALYGYTEEEALNGNLLDLIIPPEMREDVLAELKAVETGTDTIPPGELSLVRKDGSRVDVLSSHAVLRRAGRPVELFCIDVDLTERKSLESRFLRAQRLESIGTLAGGIAHDLNNMLSPVIMGASLMRQLSSDEKMHSLIDNIQRSAERGRELVKQVLSFARGADGARILVKVDQLVQEIGSIIANTFPKNIVFESELPSDLWPLTGDPTQLNQVLLNLCVNARDAMPEGGRLRIRAGNMRIDRQFAAMFAEAKPGPYVVIDVEDEGCGMDPEMIDRIFDPFFTTKAFGEGTGLGLSTALGIIRGHGGFVNVYSEVGKGSRFKLYLSAVPGGETDQGGEPEVEEIPRGNGKCVLVVDDEASVREMTRQTLETFGYTVITAEDGAEATGIFATRRGEIDLVLTDIMMPVMDGIALIRALHRIAPELPIIAASGLKTNGNLTQAKDSGVKHFLPKPYTAETILRAVHKALNAD